MDDQQVDEIEFTDRYGGRAPSLLVGCLGHCEAMGYVPISGGSLWLGVPQADGSRVMPVEHWALRDDTEPEEPWRSLWLEAEERKPSDDGWHFVKCPECNGTGRAPWRVRLTRNLPRWASSKWGFAWGHVLVRPYSNDTAALALAWDETHPEALMVAETGRDPHQPMNPWPPEPERNPYRTNYGDRLDVDNPWLWNRRIALGVLFGKRRRRARAEAVRQLHRDLEARGWALLDKWRKR